MTRFSGKIGYAERVERVKGVVEDVIVEHNARGDVLRNSVTLQSGLDVNDDLTVGNSISVIRDAYMSEHFDTIRYVKWRGVYWKVGNITEERPRLILRLGGVYNGPKPAAQP